MNKGYSLVEFLIGILLSFFVLHLCLSAFKMVKINRNPHTNQDMISSLQLHHIFNLATDIEVFDQEINFNYLNEPRTLYFVNDKIILKPGTVIYFLKVNNCTFYIEENKIYVNILRNNKTILLMLGLI